MKYSNLIILAAVMALALTGCESTRQSNLYYWDGSYADSVYKYLGRESDVQAQIDAMEQTAQKAYTAGKLLPPGFHAHLGLLYYDQGNFASAKNHFDTEAKLYPESSVYMRFLTDKKASNSNLKGKK